jgi:hypothetical protein
VHQYPRIRGTFTLRALSAKTKMGAIRLTVGS